MTKKSTDKKTGKKESAASETVTTSTKAKVKATKGKKKDEPEPSGEEEEEEEVVEVAPKKPANAAKSADAKKTKK